MSLGCIKIINNSSLSKMIQERRIIFKRCSPWDQIITKRKVDNNDNREIMKKSEIKYKLI